VQERGREGEGVGMCLWGERQTRKTVFKMTKQDRFKEMKRLISWLTLAAPCSRDRQREREREREGERGREKGV